MRRFLRKVVFPSGVVGIVRSIVAIFALLALIEHNTKHGFGPTLQLLVDRYVAAVDTLLEPLRPLVDWIVEIANGLLRIEMMVDHSLWRHVFVLVGIYLVSYAQNAFREGLIPLGIFEGTLGISVAFVTSLIVAVIPVSGYDLVLNLLVALTPICGIIGARIISSLIWYRTFGEFHEQRPGAPSRRAWSEVIGPVAHFELLLLLFILVFSPTLLLLTPVQSAQSPGLVVLLLSILIYALSRLWYARIVAQQIRLEEESISDAFWRTGQATVGAIVLNIFLWTAAIVAADSGKELIGL